MTQSAELTLWFGNQSSQGGQACIYHNTANVTFSGGTPQQLAWMVAGANPSVWVKFTWSVDYGFLWIDRASNESFGRAPADLEDANQIPLSSNQYGFLFGTPQAGDPTGALLIQEDGTIPVGSQAVAGISMAGAGTFAAAAAPRQNLAFTPVDTASLGYAITFGPYDLSVGDSITPATLNPSGAITFPAGVTVMTARLNAANAWTVTQGEPSSLPKNYIHYRAVTWGRRPALELDATSLTGYSLRAMPRPLAWILKQLLLRKLIWRPRFRQQ